MKIVYYDKNNNPDIYLEDNPYCRIRIIFIDDNDTYVFCSNDFDSQIYINRVVDVAKKPHMFFASNLEAIQDDKQFDYYYERINSLSNYQGLQTDVELDGSDDNTFIVLPDNTKYKYGN